MVRPTIVTRAGRGFQTGNQFRMTGERARCYASAMRKSLHWLAFSGRAAGLRLAIRSVAVAFCLGRMAAAQPPVPPAASAAPVADTPGPTLPVPDQANVRHDAPLGPNLPTIFVRSEERRVGE